MRKTILVLMTLMPVALNAQTYDFTTYCLHPTRRSLRNLSISA